MVLGLFRYHHQKDITMTQIIECLYVDGEKKKKEEKNEEGGVLLIDPVWSKGKAGGEYYLNLPPWRIELQTFTLQDWRSTTAL